MLENEIIDLLTEYKIYSPLHKVSKSPEEVKECSQEMGFPIVMKILSSNIWHKTDVGGIKLGINSPEEAVLAYRMIYDSVTKKVPSAKLEGVIIYPQVDHGQEIIIGVTQDYTFGPVIMFGLGGIFVEVFKDVTFRALPIDERDAYQMINGIKNREILTGFRGSEKANIPALVTLLCNVSRLVIDQRNIEELDLNPLRYVNGEWLVLDAKVKLK